MKFLPVVLIVLAVAAPGYSLAADKNCKLEITANDVMQFDKKELKVAGDCTTVTLTLKYVGKLPAQTMGHNWVLTLTSDWKAVMNAGVAAGFKNNYLPPNDKRIIATTGKLIGGGQTSTVTFPTSLLKKGGDYTYFCSYAGHGVLMNGKLIFG
jgi:azurin